jgi:protein-S-isoprenylcysteine O-methyltransferase Ste14
VNITPIGATHALWIVWGISWFVAAIWSSRTRSSASVAEQLPYRLLTIAGFFLLFGINPGRSHSYLVFWNLPRAAAWSMTGLCAVGFVFCWWARFHLGKLWSAFVTRKEDHHVIDTGPYRIVRHPIYTGLILAAAALAILKGNLYSLTGTLLIILGFWIKARLEERFLSQQLGPETYAAYRRRVPMLIPFLPS